MNSDLPSLSKRLESLCGKILVANGYQILTTDHDPEIDVLVSELIDAVIVDYRVNGKKSLEYVEMRWKAHLEPFFAHTLAAHVTSDDIEHYKQKRLQEGASNATINRELAVLKRGFHLGMRSTPPKVQRIPYFSMLAENNVRLGFVEPAQYDKLATATAKRGLWSSRNFRVWIYLRMAKIGTAESQSSPSRSFESHDHAGRWQHKEQEGPNGSHDGHCV